MEQKLGKGQVFVFSIDTIVCFGEGTEVRSEAIEKSQCKEIYTPVVV